MTLARPGSVPVEYKANSWGRLLTTFTVATNDSLLMAGQKIPIRQATFIKGADNDQVERMMKLGMGGMTGNKLFLGSILVIDISKKKFGIAR